MCIDFDARALDVEHDRQLFFFKLLGRKTNRLQINIVARGAAENFLVDGKRVLGVERQRDDCQIDIRVVPRSSGCMRAEQIRSLDGQLRPNLLEKSLDYGKGFSFCVSHVIKLSVLHRSSSQTFFHMLLEKRQLVSL